MLLKHYFRRYCSQPLGISANTSRFREGCVTIAASIPALAEWNYCATAICISQTHPSLKWENYTLKPYIWGKFVILFHISAKTILPKWVFKKVLAMIQFSLYFCTGNSILWFLRGAGQMLLWRHGNQRLGMLVLIFAIHNLMNVFTKCDPIKWH